MRIAVILVELGKMKPMEDTFRIGRFSNSTPIFSRDKRGMNIAILTVQYLFDLLKGVEGDAADRLDAIEKYNLRHLYSHDTLRSYYFIKMLLVIPAANYQRELVEKKAAKYLKKLAQIPIEEAVKTHKVEILPYETIWELALETLGKKARH